MKLGIMSVLTVPNLQRKSLQIDLSKDKENVFRTECSVFVCVCVCGTSPLVGKILLQCSTISV
jgi:hypothetical protein